MAVTNEHAEGEPTRRDFIYIATGAVAAVGVAGAVWPFISQMSPDQATIAAGAPVEIDIKAVPVGQEIKIFWRGKPIYIRHRGEKEIKDAQTVDVATLRDPQPDSARVKPGKEEWLVVIGICTHLGCVPLGYAGEYNGWFCPCHGSVYDTAGRIRQGPAPLNLALPPYAFDGNDKIIIG